MESEQERRRRAGIALITAKYLRYVDEHKSDEGFSTQGIGGLQQLRQAAVDAHLVVRTESGLELTGQGRDALHSAGSSGL